MCSSGADVVGLKWLWGLWGDGEVKYLRLLILRLMWS